MTANDGQHVIAHEAPEHTSYANMFSATRLAPDIGEWIELKKARGIWTFNVYGVQGPITSITGIIEGTHSKPIPFTIASFTQATTMPLNVQNIASRIIRCRVTAFTAGSGCIGYEVGMSFTQT
jgi:hypothetical protein